MLEKLAPREQWLLAAACAELLRPTIREWDTQQNSPETLDRLLDDALNAAWIDNTPELHASRAAALLDLYPDVEDETWTTASAAAQNTLAAIAYANRAADGDEDAPRWAITQIAEYADYLDQSGDSYIDVAIEPESVTSRADAALRLVERSIRAGASTADVRDCSREAARSLWTKAR